MYRPSHSIQHKLNDPQLQGNTWIRKRETPNNLQSCQQSFAGYLDMLAKSMEEGLPMLLEKVGESFDAVLETCMPAYYHGVRTAVRQRQ